MNDNPHPQRPNSLRLPGFDYSSKATFFLTICTKEKQPIFGDRSLRLYALQLAKEVAVKLEMVLFSCCIMPDHVHVIIHNSGKSGYGIKEYIRRFKSFTYRYWRDQTGNSSSFWQRYYHDHIIRDDRDFDEKTQYVIMNPVEDGLTTIEGDPEFVYLNFK